MAQYVRKVAKQCIACKAARPASEAPDPCLGHLPGLRFACCGHGSSSLCYLVRDEDGVRLGGEAAREELLRLGGNPAELARTGLRGWEKLPE